MPIFCITRCELTLPSVVKLTISSCGNSTLSKPHCNAAVAASGANPLPQCCLPEPPTDLDARRERCLPDGHHQTDEADELTGIRSLDCPQTETALIPVGGHSLDHLVALLRRERGRKVAHHFGIGVDLGVGRSIARRAIRASAGARSARRGVVTMASSAT